MEIIRAENLSFKYPLGKKFALLNVSFSINRGEFVTVCGKSGCGKSTLLRLLKVAIAPHGELSGEIFFDGKPLRETSMREQTERVGFVLQNPDGQLVTDKVWHELAFGLESLGVPPEEIRVRVSEMSAFFGIDRLFRKDVSTLSGGEKQLVNLASVMLLRPDVLILDEPTSQLDPIAAGEFVSALRKINLELGTTVILSEHRLEETLPVSSRIIVMDEGEIIADASPENVAEKLSGHDMSLALPTPMRVLRALDRDGKSPLTIRDGRARLGELAKITPPDETQIPKSSLRDDTAPCVIEFSDVSFRYEKNLPDVVSNMNLTVRRGELYSIVGGNGVGKSTTLALMAGLLRPNRGDIYINGKKLRTIENPYGKLIGMLPQNPESLFAHDTVSDELREMTDAENLHGDEADKLIAKLVALCHIGEFLDRHPFDLSGGEMQRVALAKLLVRSPEILLLDEPTKGLDAHFKLLFADILKTLTQNGTTIVMVSHDIEFCASFSDVSAMCFDGTIVREDTPRNFFAGTSFYTTTASRMANRILPSALLSDDILLAFGKTPQKPSPKPDIPTAPPPKITQKPKEKRNVVSLLSFAILFVLFSAAGYIGFSLSFLTPDIFRLLSVVALGAFLASLFPHEKLSEAPPERQIRKRSKKSLVLTAISLLLIPLTALCGTFLLDDRKYFFISLLMVFEVMIPFFLTFEGRKPRARELVTISVLCALAIAGRTAFFMLPQFKPVAAIVIISGIVFGAETGFMTGAISAFASNFFFGQGALTPWQMLAFGIIGAISGVLFGTLRLRRTRVTLSVFGFISTFVVYGAIMNCASALTLQPYPTAEMFYAAFIAGFPFDIIHAFSSAFFLWFLAKPMLGKLHRIQQKYGVI